MISHRSNHALGPGTAERVRILIDQRVGPGYWDGFQRYMVEDSPHQKEWRFGGALGFGGKVHYNGLRLYVTAYPEDIGRDPFMRDTIADLNVELAAALSQGNAN